MENRGENSSSEEVQDHFLNYNFDISTTKYQNHYIAIFHFLLLLPLDVGMVLILIKKIQRIVSWKKFSAAKFTHTIIIGYVCDYCFFFSEIKFLEIRLN